MYVCTCTRTHTRVLVVVTHGILFSHGWLGSTLLISSRPLELFILWLLSLMVLSASTQLAGPFPDFSCLLTFTLLSCRSMPKRSHRGQATSNWPCRPTNNQLLRPWQPEKLPPPKEHQTGREGGHECVHHICERLLSCVLHSHCKKEFVQRPASVFGSCVPTCGLMCQSDV